MYIFRLPSDPNSRAEWNKRLLGRVSGDPATLSTHTYVCSMHFDPSSFIIHSSGRMTLAPGAFPSLFENLCHRIPLSSIATNVPSTEITHATPTKRSRFVVTGENE